MIRCARCVVFACLVITTLLSGCSMLHIPQSIAYPHAMMTTLGETPEEHNERVHRILNHDRRALAEDLDLLFMTERQGRLNRWHDR